jgi:hypothetical protein
VQQTRGAALTTAHKPDWKRFFPPASPGLIERFEKGHGVVLPPRYRNYLSLTNGGQPHHTRGFLIPEINEKVMLGVLFGLSEEAGKSLSLETVIAESNDEFPHGYIPIGEDPGGNQLLLAASGEHQEEIFFRDRVGFLAKRTGKRMFRVAANIDEFLASLHVIQPR